MAADTYVEVLITTDVHGCNEVHVCTTIEIAESYLYKYIKDNWYSPEGEPVPEDINEAIEAHFHGFSLDSYDIITVPITTRRCGS